jgi:hypothetical protein
MTPIGQLSVAVLLAVILIGAGTAYGRLLGDRRRDREDDR